MSEFRSPSQDEHANRVREMFASIAGRYDLLNHLLSANVDRRWRRIVADRVRATLTSSSAQVLDVACGTGDLALTLFETTGAQIVATDFCRPMLEIAARKSSQLNGQIRFVEGDALSLPFSDRAFDVVTIGFGLRNLSNADAGLRELLRVLKPGGWLAVLDFSKPVRPLRALFQFYFGKVLPVVGGLISGSKSAYQYLPNSVQRFPDQEQLASLMAQAGFERVEYESLTCGIAALHLGRRSQF